MVSCIINGDRLAQKEMEREWKREKIKWPAMHALLAHQSAAKPKSKTTVQVCPGMRQKLEFHYSCNYSNTRTDSCFKKTISVSKLHPTEAAFLCWMSNGVWTIPYPKIWWIIQRWFQVTFLVLMRLRDLRKFWQAPGLLSYEVFHLCRSRISATVILRLVETA